VDESQLIVQAMRMSIPPKRKRKVMREIEPSLIDVSNDAISRMASKITRKPRKKPFRQWEPSDFVKYLVEALSNQSMSLERVGARDREDMAFLYDELVRRVDEQMNNTIMRDYLDWWTETHARKLFGQPVYVKSLSNERFLDQFIKLKFGTATEKSSVSAPPATTHKEVDAQTLYRMGGLSMLLRSKGIVMTASILREKNDSNWLMRISQALQNFPKNAVQETMERTIAGATYPSEDMVDFISIARPALEFHRIRDYSGINYRGYFKG
jgi:hypothetical protein